MGLARKVVSYPSTQTKEKMMLDAKLKQYSWDDLLRPFDSDDPLTDEQFTSLMAPVNSDTPIDNVPLTASPMCDPAVSGANR
jgi:hypothetical protein